MYTGAALSFGLIRACRGGLVLYCSVLSDAGGENDGSSAIFERSLLGEMLRQASQSPTALKGSQYSFTNISWYTEDCFTHVLTLSPAF